MTNKQEINRGNITIKITPTAPAYIVDKLKIAIARADHYKKKRR